MQAYRVHIDNSQPGLTGMGCGWRAVYAKQGRRWVYLVDWVSLDTGRLSLAAWRTMPKEPARPAKTRVVTTMRQRARYVRLPALARELRRELNSKET